MNKRLLTLLAFGCLGCPAAAESTPAVLANDLGNVTRRDYARQALDEAATSLLPAAQEVACACGCGFFDVGGADWMIPQRGGSIWFRYSFVNQNQNYEGTHKALASDNLDKQVKTSFFTLGGQYVVNHDWTVTGEIPLYNRAFTTTDDGSVTGSAGSLYTAHLTNFGDAKLLTTYTGFAGDRSSGITFGVKLPTGNDLGPIGPLGAAEFDRDTLPGTGSLDLVVGGYHVGKIIPDNQHLSYSVQANYELAILGKDGYRPGNELDTAVGLNYDFGKVAFLDRLMPSIELLGNFRQHDAGVNSDAINSGYSRLLIAPGVQFKINSFKVYGDVEFPIYQSYNSAHGPDIEGTAGQLAPAVIYKLQVGYDF